jgi:formylmethanofuran dehydrogenase subunit B
LRHIVFVGTGADPRLGTPSGVTVDAIAGDDDLHTTLSLLNAAVGGRRLRRELPAALVRLAQQLAAARYAVLVWEARTLDVHGALVVEALQRLVNALNLTTRAASFALGGNDGAVTAQQVVGWLSGLPLRTRISRDGLEHEPLRFAASRLLDDGAVDAVLWVASFGPQLAPPATRMPRIVLGHPALAASAGGAGTIFVPVSTPGIGSTGHLFRTDTVVALPLPRLYDDVLPTVASVASALLERMR